MRPITLIICTLICWAVAILAMAMVFIPIAKSEAWFENDHKAATTRMYDNENNMYSQLFCKWSQDKQNMTCLIATTSFSERTWIDDRPGVCTLHASKMEYDLIFSGYAGNDSNVASYSFTGPVGSCMDQDIHNVYIDLADETIEAYVHTTLQHGQGTASWCNQPLAKKRQFFRGSSGDMPIPSTCKALSVINTPMGSFPFPESSYQ